MNDTNEAGVTVRYECKQCRRGVWHTLTIRAREPGESLETWQRDVVTVVATHHRMTSPRCRSERVDMKVTVSKAAGYRLGDAPPAKPKYEGPTVRVLYTCNACGVVEVGVDVPERGKDQDVGDWAKNTMGCAIGDDHAARSPACLSDVMDMVKIPIRDAEDCRIGEAIRQ